MSACMKILPTGRSCSCFGGVPNNLHEQAGPGVGCAPDIILFKSLPPLYQIRLRFGHLARFSTAQIVDEEFCGWVSAVRSSLRRDSRREQRQSRRGVGVTAIKLYEFSLALTIC